MPLKIKPPSQRTGFHTCTREIRGCTLGKNLQRWLKQLKIKPPDIVGWWWIIQKGFLTRLALKALFRHLTGAAQNIMGSPIPHTVNDSSQAQPLNPPYNHASWWEYFLNSSYWFMLSGPKQGKLLFSHICSWTVKSSPERMRVQILMSPKGLVEALDSGLKNNMARLRSTGSGESWRVQARQPMAGCNKYSMMKVSRSGWRSCSL